MDCHRCRGEATVSVGGLPCCSKCVVLQPAFLRRLPLLGLLICGMLLAGCFPAPAPPMPEPPAPSPVVVDEKPQPAVERPLTVLILFEKDDLTRYSRAQRTVLASPKLHTWLKGHNANWRILDKDTPVAGTSPEASAWRSAVERLKPRYQGVPVMFVEGGTTPASVTPIDRSTTVEDVLKLLDSHASEAAKAAAATFQDMHSATVGRPLEIDPCLSSELLQLAL
jgi:hypothetical protein